MPKNNEGLRLYVNYRALNKLTIKNRHALPLIDETINKLFNTKIYTKLNLKDAYYRIRMKTNNKWKIAFRTRYGHFKYIIMPFGLTNIPATFQAYVNEILIGLFNIICITFLNDICIYNDLIEKYKKHVRQILDRLRTYGLYYKLFKYEFFVEKITFFKYIIEVAGVSMDFRKI
jgi:hypothetical protein